MMREVRGSKSTGWTSMLKTQKRANIAADIPRYYRSGPQASAAQIPFVHGGEGLLLQSGPSADWVRPTVARTTICLLEFHGYTCDSHPVNPLRETFRIMSDHVSGHCGPAKLTRKSNHHIHHSF